MIRISLPYIYNLSASLEPLAHIQFGAKASDLFPLFWDAKIQIETFIEQSVFSYSLRSCRTKAEELVTILDSEMEIEDGERELQPHNIIRIQFAYRDFKAVLIAEMNVLPSYFVRQKEPFDMLVLLENGVSIFSSELAIKVPESQFDASEAAKALAFELCTSCGFHLFRVVESVLRRYYSQVSSGSAPPKVRSINIYVKKMRQLSVGSEIILKALEQLSSLHRNPLIHPEVALTTEEAITIMGMARSVVSSMLNELNAPPLTTTAAMTV